jgi:hypothetical protein
MNRSPADFLRDIRVRNEAAANYERFAKNQAELAFDLDEAGAEKWSEECAHFAYIAWRASRAEHLDPGP